MEYKNKKEENRKIELLFAEQSKGQINTILNVIIILYFFSDFEINESQIAIRCD